MEEDRICKWTTRLRRTPPESRETDQSGFIRTRLNRRSRWWWQTMGTTWKSRRSRSHIGPPEIGLQEIGNSAILPQWEYRPPITSTRDPDTPREKPVARRYAWTHPTYSGIAISGKRGPDDPPPGRTPKAEKNPSAPFPPTHYPVTQAASFRQSAGSTARAGLRFAKARAAAKKKKNGRGTAIAIGS